MTGSSLDASIRRASLLAELRGTVIPDSNQKLAELPQLIMEPGVERLSMKFLDGLGLTDAYGNVYEGYGKGGYNFIWTNKAGQENNPEDFLTQDDIPSSFDPSTIDGAADGDSLVFNSGTGEYETTNIIDDALAADAVAQEEITDFISVLIETPQNKTYRLVNSLPYSIDITATDSEIVSGSASVSFPSGTVASGGDVDVTISSVSSPVDLTIRIDFTRHLNEV